VIAVLVIAGFAIPSIIGVGGGNNVTLGTANAYVEGIGTPQEIMSTTNHVDSDDDTSNDTVEYNSIPPTSGDHWSAPQPCGFYDTEVPDEIIVHNMEHSNIIVSYNLSSPDEIASLRDVFDDLGAEAERFGVARRYTKILPGQVALSAWGVNDVMDGVDKDRIEKFFDTYVGTLGPEGAISCVGSQQSMPAN
jgi:hypothetical protein